MPMFDDPKKELQRLEEQLLQEEEWFARELDSAKAMIGEVPGKKSKKPAPKAAPKAPEQPVDPQVRNFANGYGGDPVSGTVRNTDAIPEKKKKAQPKQKKKSVKGLVILAVLETLGIVGVVAYWLLFLL